MLNTLERGRRDATDLLTDAATYGPTGTQVLYLYLHLYVHLYLYLLAASATCGGPLRFQTNVRARARRHARSERAQHRQPALPRVTSGHTIRANTRRDGRHDGLWN